MCMHVDNIVTRTCQIRRTSQIRDTWASSCVVLFAADAIFSTYLGQRVRCVTSRVAVLNIIGYRIWRPCGKRCDWLFSRISTFTPKLRFERYVDRSGQSREDFEQKRRLIGTDMDCRGDAVASLS